MFLKNIISWSAWFSWFPRGTGIRCWFEGGWLSTFHLVVLVLSVVLVVSSVKNKPLPFPKQPPSSTPIDSFKTHWQGQFADSLDVGGFMRKSLVMRCKSGFKNPKFPRVVPRIVLSLRVKRLKKIQDHPPGLKVTSEIETSSEPPTKAFFL